MYRTVQYRTVQYSTVHYYFLVIEALHTKPICSLVWSKVAPSTFDERSRHRNDINLNKKFIKKSQFWISINWIRHFLKLSFIDPGSLCQQVQSVPTFPRTRQSGLTRLWLGKMTPSWMRQPISKFGRIFIVAVPVSAFPYCLHLNELTAQLELNCLIWL